jgi:hypothetical protein
MLSKLLFLGRENDGLARFTSSGIEKLYISLLGLFYSRFFDTL